MVQWFLKVLVTPRHWLRDYVLVLASLLPEVGRSLERSSSIPPSEDEGMIGNISCPPMPRSSLFWTVLGIWGFFFWGAWGSVPVLIALWQRGMRRGHVSYIGWLAGLVFGECLFSFPQFSKHNLFNLFVFPFSVLYFLCDLFDPLFFLTPFLTSSLCMVPLSVTVATAHFTPPFP